MNSKNDFLWQMPLRHVLFFMPEVWGLRRGQAPCPRWGQAPLPEMGSGTLSEMGSGTLSETGSGTLSEAGAGTLPETRADPFVRAGVRHLCLRWGLTPSGIVTYLHLRFILRCFIIVGAGGSTNIA